MRADGMQWIGRLVAAVFALGVLALVGGIAVQLHQAEGVPPLPVFLGVVGLAVLILMAGACLALISMASSARQGAEALRRMSLRGGELRAVGPATEAPAPFTPTNFAEPQLATGAGQARPHPACAARGAVAGCRTLIPICGRCGVRSRPSGGGYWRGDG